MAMSRMSFLVALLAAGSAAQKLVTPVEKVITLIEKMKTASEDEGKKEAATYKEYSCFCESKTKEKSDALLKGKDDIIELAASIESDTASKNEKIAELSQRKVKQEENLAKQSQNKNECEAKHAEYTAAEADTSNAIFALTKAIESMEATKPVLLQAGAHGSLASILAMADAMGMIHSPRHKAVYELLQKSKSAFLQQTAAVDPSDPTYKYHSNDIISLCQDLKKDFEDQKKKLDDDWAAADKICKDTEKTLADAISKNKDAMGALEKSIASLTTKISTDLGTLELERSTMVEDDAYLKDLTKQCEETAADWDQRSALRANELATLTEALKILKDKVLPTDQKANERALVQQSAKGHAKVVKAVPQKASAPVVKKESVLAVKKTARAISFLQDASVSNNEAKKELALTTLRKEAKRLHSLVLQSLVARVAGDPFMKVKELIQKLIERLVAESTGEAEKKGFCDTEMGKSKKDRDYRYADVTKLSAELAELEAKRDELQVEIKTLTSDLKSLSADLKEATKLREEQKKNNLETLATAKEGLTALKECIEILETFYRVSSRATVLAQVSPVDEDTDGPGFEGAYKGQQTRSVAILDMLQDIKSDYERTIKRTTAEEATAHADYTEFKRTSEADMSGKSKKKELSDMDLTTTLASIKTGMDNLQTQMDLLDAANKELVLLNPTCVDSGMSYQERTENREKEIAALQKALCQLDGDGVEPSCK